MIQRANKARTKWAPGAEALAAAAQAVMRVVANGRSADDALAAAERSEDRASVRAIALGTLRWYLRLVPAIETLVKNPKQLAPELHALLVTAAHQIEYSRNAPQATVHVAVDAARAMGQTRGAGLVNAVLRRFVAEREGLFSKLDSKLAVRTAHPGWLVTALQQAWPAHVEKILEANNAHPPMVLRVDTSRTDVPAYRAQLAQAGIAARYPVVPEHADQSQLRLEPVPAIELEKPVSVSMLPGFAEGLVSVQDAGAQLAAILLDAQPGMRVLDACAAPGGKTAHILQRTPDLAELVAVDIDEQRLTRVRENLARINRSATLVAADIRKPESFWDGRSFDRILVDAPCSSTGVIRRHPDIKLLRRPTDLAALAAVQLEILRATFRLLKPSGRLLYVTCSVLPVENDEPLRRFLAEEAQARLIPLPTAEILASGAVDRDVGIQLLPGAAAGSDGFYYACVEKATFAN
jgi:16S rRNA (cytosine967-C5)-methyltransferase